MFRHRSNTTLRFFGTAPQKQTTDYAKFDLIAPPLNFSLVSSPGTISAVNHLGIEVESALEVEEWGRRLQAHDMVDRVENDTDCCYARQDKVWFTDPDGNHWEVFAVLEQLPITKPLKETGCCVSTGESTDVVACGCP